mgnify:CR=1 FL=1
MKRLILSLFIIISLFIGADHQPAFANVICPAADFAALPDTAGCHPFTVDFDNLSTNACCYIWDFGDGSPIDSTANPTHTFFNTSATVDTVYCVTLVAMSLDSCTDTITKCIVVHSKPVTDFSSISVCLGDSTPFADLSIGSSFWNWDFGDGDTATMQNPAHIYSSCRNYAVQLIVSSGSGCLDTAFGMATVFSKPTADFNFVNVCFDDSILFSDASSAFLDTIVGWNWDFGDASTSILPDPTHNYTSADTFVVRLIVTTSSNCKDTILKSVIVYPKPAGSFSSDKDTANLAISGTVNFTDNTTGAISWDWDFGDGTGTANIQNPGYTYTSTGTFIVRLVVTDNNGCTDTVQATIIVINTTGIGEYLNENLKVYPNPATGTLIIESNGIEIKRIKLFNSLGQVVLDVEAKGAAQKLDISKLTEGNYIVQIETKKGVISKNVDISR